MKLEQLSAFELVEWIRSDARLLKIPVVIFTGWEMPSDIELSYKLGANSYVLKSNDPTGFENQIRKILDFWLKANVTTGKVPGGLKTPLKRRGRSSETDAKFFHGHSWPSEFW